LLLISKADIKKVFSMRDAIEADKTAFEMYSDGKAVAPLRTSIDVPRYKGQNLFMPAYVEGLDSTGVKIVSVFPGNASRGKPVVPATMVLLDGETGEVCSLIDGTYLTQLRTGAAAGAASDMLAREDSKAGALFGTGGQAATQLEAMLAARKLERVRVYDIDFDKAREFAARMQSELKQYGAEIVPASSPAEAVDDADIITTVTTSRNPVFNGTLVKKGCHINGVGAYTPEMQELDERLIARADKIYVDAREAALEEAGDLIIPMRKGIIDRNRITGELGEVVLGRIAGREKADEITVFKTVGFAVLDVVAAKMIYDRVLQEGLGQKVEL